MFAPLKQWLLPKSYQKKKAKQNLLLTVVRENHHFQDQVLSASPMREGKDRLFMKFGEVMF